MFFDARAAKLLQPGEHLVVGGCPGLRLEVSATRKTWTYRYKLDGRMKQVALGQWPALSVQAAVSLWQAARDRRSDGVDPGAERKRPAQSVYTVTQLVADYVAGVLANNRQAEGLLAARRALDRLLQDFPDFAKKPAAQVTRADVFYILDARKSTPTAAQKLRSMLGAAWDLAHDAGKLPDDAPNWWRVVMRGRLKSKGKMVGGKHQGRQRRVLQADEVATLLSWLPNMHPLGRDATLIYLWTCARGVEIFGMRPEQITQEADGWWLTVPKTKTKNARFDDAVDYRVPLVGQALEVVQRRLAAMGASGWLFEDARGEQYTQPDFSTYIYSLQPYSEKAARRQGVGLVLPVTGWTPHNLRRTSRTLLASIGCPSEIAEEIMGHMPAEMLATYNSHSYDAEKRHWLVKLAAHLTGLMPS